VKVWGGIMAYISGSIFGDTFARVVAYPVVVPGFDRFLSSITFGAAAIFGYLALLEALEYARRR